MTAPKTDFTALTDAQLIGRIASAHSRLHILNTENARRESLKRYGSTTPELLPFTATLHADEPLVVSVMATNVEDGKEIVKEIGYDWDNPAISHYFGGNYFDEDMVIAAGEHP
jgi:hypothetical protein